MPKETLFNKASVVGLPTGAGSGDDLELSMETFLSDTFIQDDRFQG